MLIGIVIVLGILLLIGILFVNLSPEFGGKATKGDIASFEKSPNYKNGQFNNLGGVQMSMDFNKMVKSLVGFFGPQPSSKPSKDIPTTKIDSVEIANYMENTRLDLVRAFDLPTSNKWKKYTVGSYAGSCSRTTSHVGRKTL